MPQHTRSAPGTQFHRIAPDDFLELSPAEQVSIVLDKSRGERFLWVRLLPLDDAADFVQAAPANERDGLLALKPSAICANEASTPVCPSTTDMFESGAGVVLQGTLL